MLQYPLLIISVLKQQAYGDDAQRTHLFTFLTALFKNKKVLFELTINEFKRRYAGNFLGFVWAILQPLFTILIMWFVFQVGFKSHNQDGIPFILWLVSGILPWFYISDALSNGTKSIIQNDFLVKKVVFRVSLLPIIPIFSALIIHLFFIVFLFGMFIYYGFYPDLYWLQLLYYLFAASVLLLGLSWFSSAITVFFRDMSQLVSIGLQFGFWLTPIFWSINTVPQQYKWIIKLNPFYYIVQGYRDSLIYHHWFWEHANLTLYFWSITAVFFSVGIFTFKGLRPQFADVL